MFFSQTNRFLIFIAICFLIFLSGVFRLPVLDRDEARFATASKTMLIEKNYIDIKMHDEVRYKKPVGIYWIQVLSNKIFGSDPFDNIAIYRLPSIIGVFLSFILVFNYLRKIYCSETAFLSVFFIVFSLIAFSETHQAKTDGILFLTIALCNLITIKFLEHKKITSFHKIIYWISLAAGILVKGPIILIFTILPVLIYSFIKKNNLLKSLFSPFAFLIFLLISVPWFILITIESNGLFWNESVGHDLLKKLASGQESHGFPPGYYLLTTFILFWPGSVLIYPAIKSLLKNFKRKSKASDSFLFLILGFFVPYFIYEIIPTKLPHYIFPAYLPLSIIISKYMIEYGIDKSIGKRYLPLILLYPLIVIVLIFFAIFEYSVIDTNLFLILFFLSSIFIISWKKIIKSFREFLIIAALFQFSFYFTLIFFVKERVDSLWIADNVNSIIDKNFSKYDLIYNYGFNEPSLVFLTSHKSKKINPQELSAGNVKNKNILFIVTDELSDSFNDNKLKKFKLIDEFSGFNYSKGKKVKFNIFDNIENE